MSTTHRYEASGTGIIFLYFGLLTFLVYLITPTGYFLDIASSYLLKNQLHATASQVSWFRLITAIPVYLAFAFGLTRDLWNPLGLRDRGYFLIFMPLTALVFGWMAAARLSYTGLLIGMLLVMFLFRFGMAAYQGLLALVAQEKLMSGRLSTIWVVVQQFPIAAGAFASGYITEHFPPGRIFVVMAALAFLMACCGFWKSRKVFSHAYEKPQARGADFGGDVKRLLKHRAIYPAVLVNFLWNFAPGANTPLQFYLTNELHASDATYGYFIGIFVVSFLPTFLLYGFLCKKVPLNKLLWWGTIVAVPQMIPLALIHSANVALLLAIPIGLMGGVATAAYYDLAIRSCPPGLQGTLMMLVDGGYFLSMRTSDVLGSWIYGRSPSHGFLFCAIAITVVYASILPVLLLVSKELVATADGERNPAVEAELAAEIAESSSL